MYKRICKGQAQVLSEVDIIEGVTAMCTAKISTEQAAAEKLEAIKRQKLKEKLLRSLENTGSIPSDDTSAENALYKIRQREFNNLMGNKE